MNETELVVENYPEYDICNEINFADQNMKVRSGIVKYSYEYYKENTNTVCYTAFKIIYFGYGFLQFSATWDCLAKTFHHDSVGILLTSIALGFCPFVGTIAGIIGANVAWGWDILYSLFIFLLPYMIVNGPIIFIILLDIYKDCKRWKAEEKNLTGSPCNFKPLNHSQDLTIPF